MKKSGLLIVAIVMLLASGCGSDGDDESETQAASDVDSGAEEPEATEPPEDSAAEPPQEEQPAPPAGGASATLTLGNGEVYEFSILCVTDPQEAAGSEILFTAVSYDDPGLDVTQFGDEGTVTDLSVVSVYDGDFNTLYEASSTYEAFGGSLTLNLDGNQITGTGDFYPGGDPAETSTPGDLVADC